MDSTIKKKHLVVLSKFDGELVVIDFRTFTKMFSMKNDINKNRYLYNLWNKDVDQIVLDKFDYSDYSELKSINDTLFLPVDIFLKSMHKWMHNPKDYILIFPHTMNEDSEWPYGEINKNSVKISASDTAEYYESDIKSKILNAIET